MFLKGTLHTLTKIGVLEHRTKSIFMKLKTITFLLSFIISIVSAFAQDDEDNENDDEYKNPKTENPKKKFHLGLLMSSYFANNYTANLYDGRGFDINGNRNNFENSWMNQKLNHQYRGIYGGQQDQIALALKVNPQEWFFDSTDMPINMRYNTAYMIGLNCRYSVDEKNAVIFNVNSTKLTIVGNFTITTFRPVNSNNNYNPYKTFAIKGNEQRLMFQMGYQRIISDNDVFNFFIEGGVHATLAKFDKNLIQINELEIDLKAYNNQTLYAAPFPSRIPVSLGFGLFGGTGIHLTMNPKWTIQLLYQATYEKINWGQNPALKLQNAVGLRAYYNFCLLLK